MAEAAYSRSFHRSHRWDLEWQDDVDVLALGEGVQVKVLYRNPETDDLDLLIKFPPGYAEPRHTHDSVHSVLALEGLQIAEGEAMHPGDYVYGGANTPHGPFEYPEDAWYCFLSRAVSNSPCPCRSRNRDRRGASAS